MLNLVPCAAVAHAAFDMSILVCSNSFFFSSAIRSSSAVIFFFISMKNFSYGNSGAGISLAPKLETTCRSK